jgi:hypothetical protein
MSILSPASSGVPISVRPGTLRTGMLPESRLPGGQHIRTLAAALALAFAFSILPSSANPTGGTVVQGSATFNTQGSQFTIQQSSATAQIN